MDSRNNNFQSRYNARCAELRAVLTLSKTEITDDGKGGTFNIRAGTDGPDCSATCDQSWCAVEKESFIDRYRRESQNENREVDASLARRLGLPTQYYNFKLKIEANPTTDSRTATVTFKTTYKTGTITVTQKPKPKKSTSNTNTNSTTATSTGTKKANQGNSNTNSTSSNGTVSSNNYSNYGSTDNSTSETELKRYLTNIEMVFVEGETFTMGSFSSKSSTNRAHCVTLKSYYIGKYEVTQGLWKAVMGKNPSQFQKSDDYPVDNISWDDCQEFIKKLNQKTGKRYRLPTEAEWEYAARGGKKNRGYKYSGGNTADYVAWYNTIGSHNVGEKYPNELGLYDMSGNVCEWCSDWYGDYSSIAQTNPKGPSIGNNRVLRGGSWYHNDTKCQVTERSCGFPSNKRGYYGMRLVLDK